MNVTRAKQLFSNVSTKIDSKLNKLEEKRLNKKMVQQEEKDRSDVVARNTSAGI